MTNQIPKQFQHVSLDGNVVDVRLSLSERVARPNQILFREEMPGCRKSGLVIIRLERGSSFDEAMSDLGFGDADAREMLAYLDPNSELDHPDLQAVLRFVLADIV